MPETNPRGLLLTAACAAALLAPAGATAATGGVPLRGEEPQVSQAGCAATQKCARGEVLRVTGSQLHSTKLVSFLGKSNTKRDDRRVRPVSTSPSELTVRVPRQAVSGPVQLTTAEGEKVSASARVVISGTAPATTNGKSGTAFALHDFVFPIRAKHDLGQGPVNNFGGGRGHKGQDMFAACGAPVVAARGGTVSQSTFQARAGNYVVITTSTGQSDVYMHLQSRSTMRRGEKIATGSPIGQVGDTGVASGCHLHFELWTAPGWMVGGKAINPLPTLRLWDAAT